MNMLMTKTESRPHLRERRARELLEPRRCTEIRLRRNLRSHRHSRTWTIFWQFWPKPLKNSYTHALFPFSQYICNICSLRIIRRHRSHNFDLVVGVKFCKNETINDNKWRGQRAVGVKFCKNEMINNNKWRCHRPWGLGAAKVEEISAATEKILLQSIALSLVETSEKQIYDEHNK